VMTTATSRPPDRVSSRAARGLAGDSPGLVAARGTPRRRSVPRMLLGGLAVVLGAVVFAVVGLRTDPGVDVLVVARPVTAGEPVVDADLRVVHIVPDPALAVFASTQRSSVVGRVAAVPLVPGSLLTAGQLGTAADPPPGQSLVAVGVKAGRAPTGVAPGALVLVLVTQDGQPSSTVRAPAVVRAVEPPDAAGVTVVSLQLADPLAVRIAAASGDVALVVQNPGR
jgi:SAF domain